MRCASRLYDTKYGMVIAWWTTGLISLLAKCFLGVYICMKTFVFGTVCLHLMMTLVGISVLVVEACRKKWKHFWGLLLGGVLSIVVYLALALLAEYRAMSSKTYFQQLETTDKYWRISEITEQVPFSIAFSPIHPFLAEYKRKVIFKSGKEFNLGVDTGGGGDFHIYGDGSKVFYVVDERHDECQVNCRIDVEHENGMDSKAPSAAILKTKKHIGYVTTQGELIMGDKKVIERKHE